MSAIMSTQITQRNISAYRATKAKTPTNDFDNGTISQNTVRKWKLLLICVKLRKSSTISGLKYVVQLYSDASIMEIV